MWKAPHRSRAAKLRRLEKARNRATKKSSRNSRRPENKWTRNLPQIGFVAFLVIAGGILQVKYARQQLESPERAFHTCHGCKGSGLLLNQHIVGPKIHGGALPVINHILSYLNEGFALEEIACAECNGVGMVYKDGHPKAMTAQMMLQISRHKLKSVKAELPFHKVECDWCSGSGVYAVPPPLQASADHRCDVCFGMGFRYLGPAESQSVCIPCFGMGRIRDDLTGVAHQCGRCDGFGVAEF